MNIFKEIGLFLYQPLYQLTSPSSAAKNASKRFCVQGGLYAAFITTFLWLGIIMISPAVKKMGDLQYAALLLGGVSLPVFMLVIGILLHVNKPAHAREYRFFKMLALPWHICASFLAAILIALIGGTIANCGEKIPTQPLPHLSTVIFIVAALCAVIFIQALKNIRKTSFLQNTGDVFVIYGIVLIPYVFMNLTK